MAIEWAQREILRINALSDEEMLTEVHYAMKGETYSWKTVNQQLQNSDINHELYHQWSIICDARRGWQNTEGKCRPFVASAVLANISQVNLSSRRAVLLWMKTIPISAGLGTKVIPLVTTNVDGASDCSPMSANSDLRDLWLDCENWTIRYLECHWADDNMADEETPLLGNMRARRGFWTLAKWLCSWEFK